MEYAVALEKQKGRRVPASDVHLSIVTILTKQAQERFSLAIPIDFISVLLPALPLHLSPVFFTRSNE